MGANGVKEFGSKGTKPKVQEHADTGRAPLISAARKREPAKESMPPDSHVVRFGKSAEEVKYTNEYCPKCKTRIDEYDFCACGATHG